MTFVLGQLIGDLIPRRFITDEDVRGRTNRGRVDQGSQRHVNAPPFAHDGIQKRAAPPAMNVVIRLLVPE